MSQLNLDDRLKRLISDVQKYEKLPDSMRLGKSYSVLEEGISACKQSILEYNQIVDNAGNVDTEPDPDKDDEVTFETRVDKLETLFKILEEEELSTDQMVELFQELSRDAKWCEDYLKNQKLQIEKVD